MAWLYSHWEGNLTHINPNACSRHCDRLRHFEALNHIHNQFKKMLSPSLTSSSSSILILHHCYYCIGWQRNLSEVCLSLTQATMFHLTKGLGLRKHKRKPQPQQDLTDSMKAYLLFFFSPILHLNKSKYCLTSRAQFTGWNVPAAQ